MASLPRKIVLTADQVAGWPIITAHDEYGPTLVRVHAENFASPELAFGFAEVLKRTAEAGALRWHAEDLEALGVQVMGEIHERGLAANTNTDVMAGLINALTVALLPLQQELDERKHSGNDEDFAALEATVAEVKAALEAAQKAEGGE